MQMGGSIAIGSIYAPTAGEYIQDQVPNQEVRIAHNTGRDSKQDSEC